MSKRRALKVARAPAKFEVMTWDSGYRWGEFVDHLCFNSIHGEMSPYWAVRYPC